MRKSILQIALPVALGFFCFSGAYAAKTCTGTLLSDNKVCNSLKTSVTSANQRTAAAEHCAGSYEKNGTRYRQCSAQVETYFVKCRSAKKVCSPPA